MVQNIFKIDAAGLLTEKVTTVWHEIITKVSAGELEYVLQKKIKARSPSS